MAKRRTLREILGIGLSMTIFTLLGCNGQPTGYVSKSTQNEQQSKDRRQLKKAEKRLKEFCEGKQFKEICRKYPSESEEIKEKYREYFEKYPEQLDLVYAARKKAKGEDNNFSFKEQVQFARRMGYDKAISKGEDVELAYRVISNQGRICYKSYVLVVGEKLLPLTEAKLKYYLSGK